MTETSDSGLVPDAQTDAQLQKPGELIRSKRDAAGMSQAQVGEALHLTVHYVKALENDEYGKLPGLTFVKGYFRAYARLLKIDEAEVLDCYDRYVAASGLQLEAQEQGLRVRRRNDQTVLWAIVTGCLLVVGLGAGWWFFGRDEQRQPAAALSLPAGSSQTGTATTQTPSPSASAQQALQQTAQQTVTQQSSPQPTDVAATASLATTAADITDSIGTAGPQAATNTLMTEDGTVVLDATTDTALYDAALSDAAPSDTVPSDTPLTDTASSVDVVTESVAADTDVTTTTEPDVSAAAEPESATEAADTADAGTAADQSADSASAADTAVAARRVELIGNGNDSLELQFNGASWVEVEDAARVRLYSNMMSSGDSLSIRAGAPFYLLLGDATGVVVELNDRSLGITSSIRSDKTARIRVSAEGVSPWVAE